MNQINKIIALSTISSTLLLASTPNIGSIEKEIKELKLQKNEVAIPNLDKNEYLAPMSYSMKTIFIKDFIITGNDNISISKLEKFYENSKNKKLTFNQIQKIATDITRYYRNSGYFVARAYIPKQNIQNNILRISIIEGKYGNIELRNNSSIKSSILQKMLDNAKDRSDVVSSNSLERAMLIIQDMPGVLISNADILPGKYVGTSDFKMTADPSKGYNGYIVTDNLGSRYTGKERVRLGLDLNSPLNIGDKISLFALTSNSSNLASGKISYSIPLLSNGTRTELSYSQTKYSLDKEYKSLDAIGTSKTIEVKTSYPLVRSRIKNLNVTLSFENKEIEDEIRSTNSSTKKDTNSVSLGLDFDNIHTNFGFNSFSNANIELKYGKLNFDSASHLATDNAGANTNGTFSKINLNLENTTFLTNKASVESSLRVQYALGNKNLDGSEDFSIGGSSGVKLYPDGEVSAENGYIFNIEAKYMLPKINNYNNSLGLFYDVGRAFMSDTSVITYKARTLQSLGIGYYLSYKDLFGQFQVAWKIDEEDISTEPNRDYRVLFHAGVVF